MRRRRTAATSPESVTPDAIIDTEATLEPTAPDAPETGSADNETPPTESTSRPRRRRTTKAEAATTESANTTPETTEPVAEVASVEETPRPRRRRSAKAADATAIEAEIPTTAPEPTVELAPVELVELAPVESGPVVESVARIADTNETTEDAGATETSGRRPRRSTRTPRRAAETVDTATETPAVVEDIRVEPPIASESLAPDVSAQTGANSNNNRRRRRNRRGGESENGSAPETTETASADVSDADREPRRTRGQRRMRTVAAPELMVGGTPATPDITDEADVAEEAAPKRTRGVRRTRAVVAADVAALVAIVPAAAVEPLPPVYQPLPAEILSRLPETRIAVRKGVPELLVNGESKLPALLFVNTEDPETLPVAQRQIRLAYEAGIRVFTILAHLPWKTRSGERRFDPLDSALEFVAQNAPDALILPRLIFSPTASWARAHESEITRYASGETGDISIASRAFWEGEAEDALRAAIERIAQSPHASKVFGVYLEHGEWLYEKGVGFDLSEANVAGFRAWLRERYKNSVVALRASWHDGSVSFETALIPAWPVPQSQNGVASLVLEDRERRFVDYHRYASEVAAAVILRLAKAVKEASANRTAVAVSYGYSLELPRAYSAHLALADLLASPNIDILTGPLSYSGRTAGGAAPLPAPIDSVALSGKLFLLEDDTKTYLASGTTPDSYNDHVTSVDATRAVHARNFGAAITHGAGISWMDLWGEGWLDDRETWRFLGGLREIAEQLATRRRNPRTRANAEPDVAVIVDEKSFALVRNDTLLDQLVSSQRDALARVGARVGFYLLSDLLRKNFPTTPKLLIFLNAFELEPAIRAAIRERFQDDGRTLAWLLGPMSLEGNVAEVADVLGISLKQQPWGSKVGSTILPNARSPLVEGLRGQKIGADIRVNPSFCVVDPRADALAEYPSGAISMAVKRHPRFQSVFLGEPELSVPLLRGLCRLASVPLYAIDDDVVWVGDNFVCVHSAPGGGTNLYLPEDAALHDLVYGETLASEGFGARYSMPPDGTRLLFFGSPAEVTRFGGEPETAQPGLTKNELPRPVGTFAQGIASAPAPAARALPSTATPEDDALFRDAIDQMTPDDDAADAVETTPTEASDDSAAGDSAGRRRRRRRRGRGRGGVGDELEGGEIDGGEGDEAEVVEAGARQRPSLEDLLPLSDAPLDGELPPVPEELQPLETALVEARPVRRRRPRRTVEPTPVEEISADVAETEARATVATPEPDPLDFDSAISGEIETIEVESMEVDGTEDSNPETGRDDSAIEPE